MVARRVVLTLFLAVLAPALPRALVAQVSPNCINCGGGYSITVTPVDTNLAFAPNAGTQTVDFTVTNTGTHVDNYTAGCNATGGVSCISVSLSSFGLDIGEHVVITVTYSVGSTSGTVALGVASSHVLRTGWGHVIISPTVTLVVPVLTSGSRAVVHNRQPLIRALFQPNGTPLDTTRTTFTWRGTSVKTLARANRALLEWEVDSTHWLGLADSAQVSVAACAQSGNCTTVTRWVVLPNDSTAVLGFTGMPLEALGREFGAPFGPGLAVSGAEVETGIGTVPYFSMGAARSAGLVYSTRQSYPRALVPVDLELTWPTGAPDQVKLILSDSGVKLDSLVVATPSCTSWSSSVRRCRAVLQGDYSTGWTFSGPTRRRLTIEARVTSGSTTKVSTDSVEVVLVDRRTTPYGSGWWPGGVLKVVAAGSDRVLVGSSGTAAIYRGNGDSVYVSPPGDFSVLTKLGSTWQLSPRGTSAKLVFDASGRLVKALDANGNKDSIVYNGATDQVTSFIDPVGKTITLGYDADGKISTFTDAGSRQTRVSVNGSTYQLTYDSISSLTTRPYTSTFVYQTYSGTGTVVLTKRIGVIKDTTEAVYDSTFRRRPVQAKLPRVPDEVGDSSVLPTVSYSAIEQRGFGALVSLESTYVGVTDPRGNWTRSLLNRWGQARKTWDALDSIGRTEYSPEGFVLWSRGKTGDSSRVNNVYDAQGLGHLVATYMKRSATDSLRLDSLVYDVNHRVIKRINPLGNAAQVTYDANGNVTSTTTPSNDVTQFWYKTNGQLDSTRAPGDAVSQIFTYDATWKNLANVKDQSGTVVLANYYDSYGRVSFAESKIRVRATGGSTMWQWRESETFANVANEVDSNRVQRTDDCNEPCLDPSWPAYPDTDTIRVQRVRYVRDRAGRDSLRVSDRGIATQYLYDRLGRLIRRRPWTDFSTARDSFAYDVIGNLRKTFTRRGDLLTAFFDSRNRDTATSVPTVGRFHKAFGGPLDQLTRIWVDSLVDSLGGVTPELRWGYDTRGRLRADTSYAGATPRVTTYAYDTYERPTTAGDAIGSWVTRYDAVRGRADTLLTPLGDTVTYTFDSKGRASGPVLHGGGAAQMVAPFWGGAGPLSSVTQTVGTTPTYTALRYDRRIFKEDPGAALNPVATLQAGAGAAVDSLQDSVVYDGWQRATIVLALKKSGQPGSSWAYVVRDTFNFDRAGNVMTGGGAEGYDTVTTRLRSQVRGASTHRFSYDSAGNLMKDSVAGTDSVRVYDYNALEQLTSVRFRGTLIARYAYDVLGRRIAKRVYSSATGGALGYTRFIYHASAVAFETDSGGTIGLRYTWGPGADQLLAVDDGTKHYYTALDKLGSVRALVRRDGTWIMSQRSGPYGAVIAKDTNANSGTSPGFALRYGWTGREYDQETGLYFFRSRYFEPAARRFIQEDPIGYAGSGNLYAYVDGDVMEANDPRGLLKSWLASYDPEPGFGWGAGCWSADCSGFESVGSQAWAGSLITVSDLQPRLEKEGDYNAYLKRASEWSAQFPPGVAAPFSYADYENAVSAVASVLQSVGAGDWRDVVFAVTNAINSGRYLYLLKDFATPSGIIHTDCGPISCQGRAAFTYSWSTPSGRQNVTLVDPDIFAYSPEVVANVMVHEYSHWLGTSDYCDMPGSAYAYAYYYTNTEVCVAKPKHL